MLIGPVFVLIMADALVNVAVLKLARGNTLLDQGASTIHSAELRLAEAHFWVVV